MPPSVELEQPQEAVPSQKEVIVAEEQTADAQQEQEPKVAELPHFKLPQLWDHEQGWGPSMLPTKYNIVPYQPFNKNAHVGKVSDWTSQRQQNRTIHSNFGFEYNTAEQRGFKTVD